MSANVKPLETRTFPELSNGRINILQIFSILPYPCQVAGQRSFVEAFALHVVFLQT
jgi:hypothetical protein